MFPGSNSFWLNLTDWQACKSLCNVSIGLFYQKWGSAIHISPAMSTVNDLTLKAFKRFISSKSQCDSVVQRPAVSSKHFWANSQCQQDKLSVKVEQAKCHWKCMKPRGLWRIDCKQLLVQITQDCRASLEYRHIKKWFREPVDSLMSYHWTGSRDWALLVLSQSVSGRLELLRLQTFLRSRKYQCEG